MTTATPTDLPVRVRRGAPAGRDARDRVLVHRCQSEGDQRLFDETVLAFAPLARSLARRYKRGEEPLEDLEQVAFMGLVKAVRGFDAANGASFAAYAVPTIVGELRRHFRDRGWFLHVPRSTQELSQAVRRAEHDLASAGGRAPTVQEVCAHLGRSEEDVLEAREAIHAMRPESIDRPATEDGDAPAVLDVLGVEDTGMRAVEDHALVEQLLATLPPEDEEVVRLRYYGGLTQAEIGRRIGVSQMQVSRILARIMDRLNGEAR